MTGLSMRRVIFYATLRDYVRMHLIDNQQVKYVLVTSFSILRDLPNSQDYLR